MKTSGSGFRRTGKIAGIFLLVLGVVLLIADRLLPQVYFAKITLEVGPDNSGPIGIFDGNPEQREAAFMARQLQLLRSSEILDQVIANLKLNEVWIKNGRPLPMQQASAWLADSLVLRRLPSRGMIEIGVYAGDPVEAANTANTIVVVYQQSRLAKLQKLIDRGMEQLKDEIEKQRKRAEEALAEATAIKERDGIFDPDPDSMGLDWASSQNNADLRPYLEAKTRALQVKRIFEAARTKYQVELLTHDESNPAKIWEKAEPPAKPTRFCLYRLRYAFAR